jgi:hypothetical protein
LIIGELYAAAYQLGNDIVRPVSGGILNRLPDEEHLLNYTRRGDEHGVSGHRGAWLKRIAEDV